MLKNVLSGLAIAVLAATSLTGCSLDSKMACNSTPFEVPSKAARQVAAIVAPTDTFVSIDNVISAAKPKISRALNLNHTEFSVVVGDGSPRKLADTGINFPSTDKDDIKNEISFRMQSLDDVSSCLASGHGKSKDSPEGFATTPESDLLKALAIASDGMKDNKPGNEIEVLSNGIQTAGQYKMQVQGLPSSPAAVGSIVSALKEQGALPNLQGATVNWFGMGQVDGSNQKQLNQQTADTLMQFWKQAIVASNGKVGQIVQSIASKDPSPKSIKVSTLANLQGACLFTLGQDQGFGFNADSAVFTDPTMATNAAAAMAKQIKASNCGSGLAVTGYTASGTNKDKFNPAAQIALSLARAKAFVTLLQQAGVTQKLKAVGGGKGPVNDWNPDGSFNEQLGKQNRKVVVTQQ